jgi:hypothetical protein
MFASISLLHHSTDRSSQLAARLIDSLKHTHKSGAERTCFNIRGPCFLPYNNTGQTPFQSADTERIRYITPRNMLGPSSITRKRVILIIEI